jgi:hypothetical protein
LSTNPGLITAINDYPFDQDIFLQLGYTQSFPGDKILLTVGEFPRFNFDGNQYLSNQQINFRRSGCRPGPGARQLPGPGRARHMDALTSSAASQAGRWRLEDNQRRASSSTGWQPSWRVAPFPPKGASRQQA